MAIQAEVLAAARRLCRSRQDWTFTPAEIVRALPHLNARSIRTHVVSRCCVNAPQHHAHRWAYFRRIRRGVYEILPSHRRRATTRTRQDARAAGRVAESAVSFTANHEIARPSVHAVVTESEGWYVAECLEVALVTQGRSLDETVANLRSGLELHLSAGDHAYLGVAAEPHLVVSYETQGLPSR